MLPVFTFLLLSSSPEALDLTFELSTGFSDTRIWGYGGRRPGPHFSPFSAAAGIYLSERTSIQLRVTSNLVTVSEDHGGNTYLLWGTAFGVRHWFTQELFLGVGGGISLFLLAPAIEDPNDVDRGLLATLQVGYRLWSQGPYAICLGSEFAHSFYADGDGISALSMKVGFYYR